MIKILCIDDEQSILFALSAIIKSRGWKPLTATDINKGLELIKDHNPNVILVDYHMPNINGLEGVLMIREIAPDTPILVLTIESSQEIADKFLEAGATDFAIKPFRAPDLISRINLHLKLSKEKSDVDISSIIEYIPKGISKETLSHFINEMSKWDTYKTVEEISKSVDISEQSIYRYLQFLEQVEWVEIQSSYGNVGRPKQRYKLK